MPPLRTLEPRVGAGRHKVQKYLLFTYGYDGLCLLSDRDSHTSGGWLRLTIMVILCECGPPSRTDAAATANSRSLSQMRSWFPAKVSKCAAKDSVASLPPGQAPGLSTGRVSDHRNEQGSEGPRKAPMEFDGSLRLSLCPIGSGVQEIRMEHDFQRWLGGL